jgi:hypothetical protein
MDDTGSPGGRNAMTIVALPKSAREERFRSVKKALRKQPGFLTPRPGNHSGGLA